MNSYIKGEQVLLLAEAFQDLCLITLRNCITQEVQECAFMIVNQVKALNSHRKSPGVMSCSSLLFLVIQVSKYIRKWVVNSEFIHNVLNKGNCIGFSQNGISQNWCSNVRIFFIKYEDFEVDRFQVSCLKESLLFHIVKHQ